MKALVPADVDLTDFAFMPFEFGRLFNSETWILSNDAEKVAAITLWGKSWDEVPAGSLPDDDRMLAHLSGAGPRWKKLKLMALRGWVKADDGRLYHPVVCEKALGAWCEKLSQRLSSGAGNAKRWGAEFDPSAIEAQILDTRRHLADLNPHSRVLSRRKAPGIPTGSKKIPNGKEKVIPLGSQETETGKSKEQELPATPGGDAPPVDPIWGSGLAFLKRKGIPEPAARSLLGKVRKSAGDVETGAILARAEAEDVSDPAPWILTAASNAKARAGPSQGAPISRQLQAINALNETAAHVTQLTPDWLIRELRDGLQKLVCLSLDSPPSADLIGATLLSWAETIAHGRAWEEERDAPRFRAAFRTLFGRLRRWPAPVDFLDALPRMESQRITGQLESDESRENGLRHLADIAARLKIEPVKPYTEVDDERAAG